MVDMQRAWCVVVTILSIALTSQALRCYDSIKVEARGFVVENSSVERTCPANHRCLHLGTDIVTPLARKRGVKGSLAVGNCIPSVACDELKCEALVTSGVIGQSNQEASFENCRATCCGHDLCNDITKGPRDVAPPLGPDGGSTLPPTAQPPVMPGPATGLRCYSTMKVKSNGNLFVNRRVEQDCPGPQSCFYLTSDTVTTVDGFNVSGSIVMANCFPTAACQQLDCETLQKSGTMSSLSGNVTFINCRISCCYEDLCNHLPGDGDPVGQPGPLVPGAPNMDGVGPSAGVRCYDSTKLESMGNVVANESTERTCPSQHSCLYITSDTVTTVEDFGEVRGHISMGNCTPSIACDQISCDRVRGLMQFGGEQFRIENCRVSCCSSDLCNDGHNVEADAVEPDDSAPHHEVCGAPVRLAQVGVTQMLTSPGWPSSYVNNVTCRWTVRAPPGHVVRFTVDSFRTETCCDELRFYNSNNVLIETFAGWRSRGSTVTSEESNILVAFESDETFSYDGFALNFTASAVVN